MTLVQQLVDLGMRPCALDLFFKVYEIDHTKLRISTNYSFAEYYCVVDDSGEVTDVYAKDEVFWRKSK